MTMRNFAFIHASKHHHFNHNRHLKRGDIFQQVRAPAEWRQLATRSEPAVRGETATFTRTQPVGMPAPL